MINNVQIFYFLQNFLIEKYLQKGLMFAHAKFPLLYIEILH